MNSALATASVAAVVYPDTDGLPLAEDTKHFNAITTLEWNLEIQFKDDPQVFVAGDLFWYPEEGNNARRTAPDVMVVFDVPKGDRSSYMQWVEKGIAPQVVFEILHPGSDVFEMSNKFGIYDWQGVEEYYLFDPERGTWGGWIRKGQCLDQVKAMHGWTSPRLGIRFESVPGEEMTVYGANGERFRTVLEMDELREEIEGRLAKTEETLELERLAREQATRRADDAEQRANKLLAALQAAGIEAPASRRRHRGAGIETPA